MITFLAIAALSGFILNLHLKQKKIMAEYAEFESLLNRHDAAIEDIKEDIEALKEQTVNLGLTLEQEETLLAAFRSLVGKVENLASENPATPPVDEPVDPSPEDPGLEEEV